MNQIIEINHICRGYCKLPYPNHPNGCPNFNKNPNCPPKVQIVEEVFDINKDLFFVVEKFNLKTHVEQTKLNHPKWSELQLKNVLYWQGSVRKNLREKVIQYIHETDNSMIYTLLPEAMGVMVIDTAQKIGIPIERNPKNNVFKIALVGYPKITEEPNKDSMFNF